MNPLTPGDGSPLLSLPFDHYQRYHLTQRLVALLWPRRKRQPLRVLDVGGSSSSLKHFLPDDEIVLADVQSPPPFTYLESVPFIYDAYVLAAGGRLPFADASFDLVTAHDTLEHVPNDLRPAFLGDLLRVARRFVVLNGPESDPAVVDAEQRLALLLERTELGENTSLKEHSNLGLPDKKLVGSFLRQQGLAFFAIPNGDLRLWLAMMGIKHYLMALPNSDALHEVIDRTYNSLLSPQDIGGHCYRQAYVIAKNPGDAKRLRQVEASFEPLLTKPPVLSGIEFAETLLTALEGHARAVRGHIASLQDALAQTRAALPQKDQHIANTEDALASTQAALLDRDQHIENIQDTLAGKDQHIANTEEALAQTQTSLLDRDQHIANIQDALADKDQHIANAQDALAQTQTALDETEEQLREVRQQFQVTTSTVGYRLLTRARAVVNRLAPPETRRRGALKLPMKGLRIILTEGWGTFLRRAVRVWRWGPRILRPARSAAQEGSLDEQYQLWLRAHALTPARIRRIRKEAAGLSYRPKVSIIMPVYNPDPSWLRDAIESVRAQLYDNWEFCIADDASSKPAVRALLKEYQDDKRIKITYLKKNHGISAASNAALAMATGEYVGFLDHDDELKPDALYEMVKLLNEQPDLDFIYSDEDKRSLEGRLVQPFFKPDWSPDLLLSVNYVPHFAVYRKRLVDEVGGLRSKCDFSQDYDLVLRVTERTSRIGHVALPLYVWRMVPGSAASQLDAKPKAIKAAKRALADAMQRRGVKADILDGSAKTTYRVRYRIQGQPLVSIVIPTRDRVDLLSRCIASIEAKTSYPNYEIIIVDNESTDERTIDYLKKSRHRCLPFPGRFHFASMMNFAIRAVAGEHVILLNNDTEIITDEWIEAMLEHSQRPEVAAVGARLFYPDRRVQHEGVIMGLGGGSAGNVDHGGYFGLGELVRNCSAVTAACMMTRRDVFERLEGFDEKLGIAFNDVDYCLRARELGYLIVYTPYSVLYHYEGGTRGKLHPMEDEQYFRDRWGNPGEYQDPYYNPNLDLHRPFAIRS